MRYLLLYPINTRLSKYSSLLSHRWVAVFLSPQRRELFCDGPRGEEANCVRKFAKEEEEVLAPLADLALYCKHVMTGTS